MKNLRGRGVELHGMQAYPTLQSQVARFSKAGWNPLPAPPPSQAQERRFGAAAEEHEAEKSSEGSKSSGRCGWNMLEVWPFFALSSIRWVLIFVCAGAFSPCYYFSYLNFWFFMARSKVYEQFLDTKARRIAESLEFLDELEEWQLLMSHYCLCLATTGGDGGIRSRSVAPLAARLVKSLNAPPP